MLRSAKGCTYPDNIDLVFHGVHYVRMKTFIHLERICKNENNDILDIEREIGEIESTHTLFKLQCQGQDFFIVAVALSIDRNTRELSDMVLQGIGHLPL